MCYLFVFNSLNLYSASKSMSFFQFVGSVGGSSNTMSLHMFVSHISSNSRWRLRPTYGGWTTGNCSNVSIFSTITSISIRIILLLLLERSAGIRAADRICWHTDQMEEALALWDVAQQRILLRERNRFPLIGNPIAIDVDGFLHPHPTPLSTCNRNMHRKHAMCPTP